MKKNALTPKAAELLLAGVITARASSYLFSKLILKGMGMFNLLGLRFTLATVLLGLLFFPRLTHLRKNTVAAGMVMGGMYFLVMTAELSGLKRMASGSASFLVNTAIVLVPLLQALRKRRLPEGKVIGSVLPGFGGVAVLTLGGGLGFGAGERWCLLAALLYACTILVTDRLSHSGIDTLAAGIVQVATIAALSLAASFLKESHRLPDSAAEWVGIGMLTIVCTGFGFTLQPVAQSGTSAEKTGLFCALNPMVASCLGIVFLHEPFTAKSLVGGILILSAILLAELPKPRGKLLRHNAKEQQSPC